MSTETAIDRTTVGDAVRSIGLPLVLTSTLGATLGVVFAQFLDSLGDGVAAEILGGDAVLFNNRAEFTGATDLAYVGGFILCLVVGLLFLFAYPAQRIYDLSKLTFLWMTLHLLRHALSDALLVGLDEGSQIALAYNTFEAPPGLDVVISAAGGLGLVLIGLGAASAFLSFAPHRRRISTPRKRFMFVLWIVVVPAAASVFLALPFFSPDAGSGVVPALPLTAVMFLLTLAAAPGTSSVIGPEDERSYGWPFGLAATMVVILIAYVVLFRNGVSIDPTQWG